MIDRPRHFEVLHLRVGKGLVDRIDRPARHADLVHQLDPIGGRALLGDLADPFVERLAVFRALRPGRVIGIVEQRHRIGRLAKAAEHVVAGGGDVDLPVRGREDARSGCRSDGRCRLAWRPRRPSASASAWKSSMKICASSSEVCTHWPSPLVSRSISAIIIACASSSPAQRSSIGMPTRTGPCPGKPVIDISPPMPWAIWSTPGRLA